MKTMYQDIESTVLNRGNTGKCFKLERGVWQGCLLYAYLFTTTFETLVNKIRKDKYIKGIKIDKQNIKISLLADDITLILCDINSVQNSFKILKSFSKCAGLKINVDIKYRQNILDY